VGETVSNLEKGGTTRTGWGYFRSGNGCREVAFLGGCLGITGIRTSYFLGLPRYHEKNKRERRRRPGTDPRVERRK